VVQIASPDEAIVIDTLAEGIDLKTLLRADGGREGAEGLPRRGRISRCLASRGHRPAPDFRHPVAAHGARYGDSIAYDQLVERITATGRQDPPLHRLVARPLSKEQIHYAVSDVTICATSSQRSTPTSRSAAATSG